LFIPLHDEIIVEARDAIEEKIGRFASQYNSGIAGWSLFFSPPTGICK
jgi:hypothetical protein